MALIDWRTRLKDVEPLATLGELPDFGFQFFFRNMGRFRRPFLFLSLCALCSRLLKFSTLYLLSQIVSNISSLSVNEIFSRYIPAWIACVTIAETLDYFTRRYSEAFPQVYAEYTTYRFYLALMELDPARLFNFSKERLAALVGRYVGNIQAFVGDWFWGGISKLVNFAMVLCILTYQSPIVLAVNLAYMSLFLAFALGISARFSAVANRYTEQQLENATVLGNFVLNLNTLKRLRLGGFFRATNVRMLGLGWERVEELKAFHAWRWIVQLNLFNVIYIGTLAYGIYQVKIGVMGLGILVLLKWAFDELWDILVYLIEYYVSLIQQREDARIVRAKLRELSGVQACQGATVETPHEWRAIRLRNVEAKFVSDVGSQREIKIAVPELILNRGDRIGIVGPSGTGKSTIINVLTRLVPFSGEVTIDGRVVSERFNLDNRIAVITNHDPLFKLSLRENLFLGNEHEPARVKALLDGLQLADFATNLDAVVGAAAFNLSAGQEQRVRLMRGFLQDADIYLLDEPFNGLDQTLRDRVLEFLDRFLAGKTVVLVTHSYAELKLVQQTFELHDSVLQRKC